MEHAHIQKFIAVQKVLQCPLCGGRVRIANGSIRCPKGHCFDISAKGYVNFLPNQKPLKGYDAAFFESRRRIFEAGLYSHVLTQIQQYIADSGAPGLIVDAGCGEGYYARNIRQATGAQVFALDVSKEAIKVAAAGKGDVCWLVADIAHVPLARRSADCLLNIFTPANYSEFQRLLTPGGLILKVIPGQEHMAELRHAARDHIRSETYSNQQVADYFQQHFPLIGRLRAKASYPMGKQLLGDLFAMTPLLFGVDAGVLGGFDIGQITIDAEVLVGKAADFKKTDCKKAGSRFKK